jgi:hypothetical protein
MLENDSTQLLLRHINGGIRCAIKDHPEFGLKPEHMGSVSKRIINSLVGEVVTMARRDIVASVSKEFVYQEIQKENEALREKIEAIAKSNRFMLEKLKENGILI